MELDEIAMHKLVYILTVHHTSRFRNDYAWDCLDFDFSELPIQSQM